MSKQFISFYVEALNLKIYLLPRDPVTICEMRSMDNTLLCYGISRRKLGTVVKHTKRFLIFADPDTYNPLKGMKQALKSAILKSNFKDDNDRAAIWTAFHKEFPIQKVEKNVLVL